MLRKYQKINQTKYRIMETENKLNYPTELKNLNYEYGLDLKSFLETIEFIAYQNLNGLDENTSTENTLERILAISRRAKEMIKPDRYENLQLFLNAIPPKDEIDLINRTTYWE